MRKFALYEGNQLKSFLEPELGSPVSYVDNLASNGMRFSCQLVVKFCSQNVMKTSSVEQIDEAITVPGTIYLDN